MPAITSYSDYVGENTIAQVSNVDFRAELTVFISKYEKDYLKKVLGESLYNSFMTGLSDPSPDAKWLSLRDKVKPALVDYVYYRYQDDGITKTVGTGEIKPEVRNADVASVQGKMVRAWNEMVNYTRDIIEWLSVEVDDYPHEDQLYCNYMELVNHINQFNL